jgi:hypothetical protein
VAVLRPGQFTGEVTILSGRLGLVRIRAGEAGAVIELERQHLLALVQTDSELSDIFMRAFILRRVELIAHGFGELVLVGSSHSANTLPVPPAARCVRWLWMYMLNGGLPRRPDRFKPGWIRARYPTMPSVMARGVHGSSSITITIVSASIMTDVRCVLAG